MTLRRVFYASRCSFIRTQSRGLSVFGFSRSGLGTRVMPAAAVLAWLGMSQLSNAQDFDPPPGAAAPVDAPPPAAAAPAAEPPPAAAQDFSEPGPPATSSAAPGPVNSISDLGLDSQSALDPSYGGTIADSGVLRDEARAESLKQGLGLSGASGLLHTQSASVGSPGTFRLSLTTGIYGGSGFLCTTSSTCNDSNGSPATRIDQTDRVAAHFFLSASPADFLEVYGGIYSYSTSTNRPVSQLKQVVGDWSLGAKALFLKPEVDQVFSAGASAELQFATGSGQVGISGIDAVNLEMRLVASADLNQRRGGRLPVKVHANLGYLFDNSANLIEDYERAQDVYIQRIERFSLNINRVDSIPFTIGAEGTFKAIHPFAEWSADIPITHLRGDFRCVRQGLENTNPGDHCMQDAAGFSSTPSRLTVGARVFPWELAPWWIEGVALVGAAEFGTGAVSDFMVEVAPEVPWSVWFGLSLSADTKPQVIVQEVALPAAELPPEALRVHGIVVEKDSNTAIADALIRFDGRNMTGLISTPEGDFLTAALDPGLYTFRINAEGYKEGTCSVEVLGAEYTTEALGQKPTSRPLSDNRHGAFASANAPEALGPPGLRCELEPLPLVSNVNGRIQNGSSGAAVGTAIASITDVLGRHLELQVDEVGAFRFQNVPPGAARVTLRADGFFTSVTEININAPQEIDQTFVLFPVPEKPPVTVKANSLRVERSIAFETGDSTLSAATLRTIQEIAAFLIEQGTLGSIEVQGHTVEAAEEELSSTRANAIRNSLVLHGVPSGRITAKGYGNSVPRSEDKSATKGDSDERIQFAITKQESTPLPF